jgi:predicted AlkP superfamily pyrophosphatase or phosphodiesterase
LEGIALSAARPALTHVPCPSVPARSYTDDPILFFRIFFSFVSIDESAYTDTIRNCWPCLKKKKVKKKKVKEKSKFIDVDWPLFHPCNIGVVRREIMQTGNISERMVDAFTVFTNFSFWLAIYKIQHTKNGKQNISHCIYIYVL